VPRLVKGAKWTYGWVTVSRARVITIPPDAWWEFGFWQGDEALFLPGSRRSGGFAISTAALLSGPLGRATSRILARGRFGKGQVVLPFEIDLPSSTRLLAVRGSRRGLGFVEKGPIYDEALKQTHKLELFD
jgi:hypothetical protein